MLAERGAGPGLGEEDAVAEALRTSERVGDALGADVKKGVEVRAILVGRVVGAHVVYEALAFDAACETDRMGLRLAVEAPTGRSIWTSCIAATAGVEWRWRECRV